MIEIAGSLQHSCSARNAMNQELQAIVCDRRHRPVHSKLQFPRRRITVNWLDHGGGAELIVAELGADPGRTVAPGDRESDQDTFGHGRARGPKEAPILPSLAGPGAEDRALPDQLEPPRGA